MTDCADKFETAVSLIAAGLREKELGADGGGYRFSKKFLHGVNMFFSVYVESTDLPTAEVLRGAHEAAFIQNYAFRPVSDWVENFRPEALSEIQEKARNVYHLGPLCYELGRNRFHITEDCGDYLQILDNQDITSELEERRFYEDLIALPQESYAAIRKFVIRNPFADGAEVRKLKVAHSSEAAVRAVNRAYEPITEELYVCPHCGWTMRKSGDCLLPDCKNHLSGATKILKPETDVLRLKRGVMRYVAFPGKLELKIFDFCENQALRVTLWPGKDRYDLEILFPDGGIWEIDAKDYRNPYMLCEKIDKGGGFPAGEFEKGFYVVDKRSTERKADYLDIVNRTVGKYAKGLPVRCVSFRQLQSEIKRRLAHA